MRITNELINKMAPKGNMTHAQLAYLGEKQTKGWQKRIIGKVITYGEYSELCEMGWLKEQKRVGSKPIFAELSDVGIPKNLSFSEQYRHPNWQRVRLLIMKRDGFMCTCCRDKHTLLNVHHKRYPRNGFIWNVPESWLITLCVRCHQKEHPNKNIDKKELKPYTSNKKMYSPKL